MKRYAIAATGIGLIALVIGMTTPGQVIAQTFKPAMSLIVNDTTSPVPVRVVTPATAPAVVCSLDLGSSVGPQGSFYLATGSKSMTDVKCPDGTARIEVRRLAYSPDIGTPTLNVAAYRLTLLLDSPSDPAAVVAVITDAAAAIEPLRAFRLDTTAANTLAWRAGLTSGIAEYTPKSGGTVFFIGTATP